MNEQEDQQQKPHLTLSPSFGDDRKKAISSVDRSAEDDSDDEFEFSVNATWPLTDPADDIFSNGRILSVYPVLNQSPLKADPDPSVQLRTLLISDQVKLRSGSTSSSSSEESLEIDALPADGTYCPWTPRSAPQSPDRCKKSGSTGSGSGPGSTTSKRWRMRDLVGRRRSHSDGKETFVFLNNPNASSESGFKEKAGLSPSPSPSPREDKNKKTKKVKEMDLVTAHKLFYGKEKKEGEKAGRRSFLPYKPELVGLFVKSRAHHLHPF